MRRFLFLLKSYPDIDHMAPAIWACLERGDHASLVFEQRYDHADDYRIQFLRRYERCRVMNLAGVESRYTGIQLLSRVRWRRSALRGLLERERVDACFFEWGEGIPVNIDEPFVARLRERRAAVRFQSSLPADVAHELLKPVRLALLLACRDAGIPAIALPHGISTKMDMAYNPKLSSMIEKHGGVLPLADRNAFTVWVHNTRRERDLSVTVNGMRPEIAQIWGSLRFSPEWMQIMRAECPAAGVPACLPEQRCVVFFLPKWRNNIDRAATVELLRQLAARRDVQLVLKEHPRMGTSELADADLDDLVRRSNVCRARRGDHSAALVTAADVVIDIGSGMALDAVLQQRHLIYPAYLHTNRLAWDEWGGCLFARGHQEVHRHLDRIVAGEQPVLTGAAVEPVVRELVYGGRPLYNIGDYYHVCIEAVLDGRRSAEPVPAQAAAACQ